MNKKFTKSEADQHNTLTEKGWAILNEYILLLGRGQVKVDVSAKGRLQKATALFHEALLINPNSYSSKWALGKIHQVSGDRLASLKCFEEAFALEQGNADICREASLAAMDCAEFTKALTFSDKALELNPDNAGLHCNRALVLMFLNQDADAIAAVDSSLQVNPQDKISHNVKALILAIANGSRPRPKTMKEL